VTGFLGYDAARLHRLRDLLGSLEAERTCTRATDPAVAAPLAGYRLAVVRVLGHTPRLDALLACRAGSDYRPVGPDTAVADLLTLSRAGTWAVVTDPVTADVVVPPSAVAEAVARAVEEHGAPAADRWPGLAAALMTVATDRAAANLLLRRIGAAELDRLVADLTAELWPGRDAARASATVRAFGAVIAAAPCGEAYVLRWAEDQPVVAALVLEGGAHAGGWAGAPLAALAATVLTALAGVLPDTSRRARQVAHDGVLSALAQDADAAREVLATLDDVALEHLLTTPWRDASLLGEVLLGATDPTTTPAAEAARIVPRVLRVLAGAGARVSSEPPPDASLAPDPNDPLHPALEEPPAEVPRGVGRMAGWWAEALVGRREGADGADGGAPEGYPLAPWPMEAREAARLLGWVASFDDERIGLLEASTATYVVRAATLDDPALLGHAAYVTSAVLDVIHTVQLRQAADDLAQRDALVGLFEEIAGATSIGTVVTVVGATAEALTGMNPVRDLVLPASWGPEALADAGAHLVAGADARVVTLQVLAASAVTGRYVIDHPRSRVEPPPPAPTADADDVDAGDKGDAVSAAWEASYTQWLDSLPRGLRADVDAAVQHVGSAARAASGFVA
jgi:hypothetical protein